MTEEGEQITLSALHKALRRDLFAAGVDTADLDSRIILKNRTGKDYTDLIAHGDDEFFMAQEVYDLIQKDLDRRIDGEPLSRIYGSREFWGLSFDLSEHVLDPRPDTETLVEACLAWRQRKEVRQKKSLRILDIGTGSGCILTSLLHEWTDCEGVGVDLSPEAVKTAVANAKKHGTFDRSHFYCGSWGYAVRGPFDLIVSNPPYIPNRVIESLAPEVRKHDPILALAGGEDGLDAYKIIVTEIKRLLSPIGSLFLEIGFDQLDDVTRLVKNESATLKRVHSDLAGWPRVVEISYGDKQQNL